MKIVKAGFEIMDPLNGEEILKKIEKVARVCYKSEDKIKEGSAEKMVRALVRRGHEAMLEHFSFSVKFTVDRGVSHEIVRHRVASFAQESTRYCNYGHDGEIVTMKIDRTKRVKVLAISDYDIVTVQDIETGVRLKIDINDLEPLGGAYEE